MNARAFSSSWGTAMNAELVVLFPLANRDARIPDYTWLSLAEKVKEARGAERCALLSASLRRSIKAWEVPAGSIHDMPRMVVNSGIDIIFIVRASRDGRYVREQGSLG